METIQIEKVKKLVPVLRFSEFADVFSSRIFDEITEITRLAGYEYSQYWEENENEEIIALRGYNIGKGKLDLIKLSYISNDLSLKLKRSRLYKGDIVYPCVGSIGHAVVIEENDKFHIQQNIAKITCKKDISPFFIMHFLTSHYGMNEVYRFNASGAQPNVLVGSLRKYKINIPSLLEQQKIASFLSAVDEKIQQLNRKKELMEQYKKGVMQQLFSGELRFKDEDGKDYPKWEEKKIKEIFIVTRGNVLSMTMVSDKQNENNKYPVYSSQTKKNGLSGYYDKFLFEDCITWTTDGAGAGDVNFRKGKFYCTNVCGVLKSDKGYANVFIAEILNTISRKYVSYVGNPKLMNNVMSEISISIPESIKEQQKIANFLSSIDTKIESTTKQITQTQTFKKGLLQKMFV